MRKRELSLEKPYLRHCWAHSEQRMSEYQRRASLLRTGPSHWRQGGRQAGRQQRELERQGANSTPEPASSNKLWAGSQLLTKTSWDPGRLTSTRRVAARDQLPRRDTQHTWEGPPTAHPGNQVAGMGEVIRCTPPHLGRLHLPSNGSPELLGPGKGTKRRPIPVCVLVEYPRTWTWAA